MIDEDRGDTYTISGSFGSFDGLGDYAAIVGDSFVPLRDINFETLTQTFGFPVNIVIATNGVPSFSVSWDTSSIRDVNDAPVIADLSPSKYVDADVETSIPLSSMFYDEDAFDSLTFNATQNGGALPSWLQFVSPDTLTATPSVADVGVYEIAVTATDTSGASVTKTFTITVEDPVEVFGTLGNDTIRIVSTNNTGSSWSVFINGTRTNSGPLVSSLLIEGNAGNDELIIEGSNSTDNFVFGGETISVGSLRSRFYNFESIEIRGRDGNDQFNFTGENNPSSGFEVLGGGGSDTLIGPDLANSWIVDDSNSGNLGQVAFSGTENLVGGNLDDLFVMLSDGRAGSIDGRGGNNELDYTQRSSDVSVTLNDFGSQSGSATHVASFIGIKSFSTNPLEDNRFTLAGTVSGGARWWSYADHLVLLEQLSLRGFKSLVGSPDQDNFYLTEGASPLDIDGSAGFDYIAQDSAFAVLDLRNSSGTGIASFRGVESFITWAQTSELYGRNNNTTWSLTPGAVSVQGLEFRNYQTIFAGTRNDTFEIAPYFSFTNSIVGGAGEDTIRTVDPTEDFTVAYWLLSGVGTGRLTSMYWHNVDFSGIENLAGGQVDYDFINFVAVPTQTWFASLTGLSTGNIFVTYPASSWVSGTSTVEPVNDPPVEVNLETKTATGFGNWEFVQRWIGNSNSDRLIGPNSNTTWYISSFGGATIDIRTIFDGFETIVGGTRNDTFKVDSGAALPLRIEGGAGRNTLDFTNFPTSVNVDLAAGTGSPFPLGLSGFTDVIGSTFDDVISGNGADNILLGLDGNDILHGLAGHDVLFGGNGMDQLFGGNGRDLLVGGLGADFLYGGIGDDILISGVSLFLNDERNPVTLDRAAIAAIMADWTSNRSYADRLTSIRNGTSSGGAYRLDSSTVFDDADLDHVFGEGGRDWFWLDSFDISDAENSEARD